MSTCSDLPDIEIARGTSDPPMMIRFSPMVGAGSQWRIAILPYGGEQLNLSTLDGSISAYADVTEVDGENVQATTVQWSYTVSQSRLIPVGRLTQYEVEHIGPDGSERLMASGYIVGVGGLNVDN